MRRRRILADPTASGAPAAQPPIACTDVPLS
jgi:hypothetical protein